ncbi:EthD family reductase [Haloactinomyces albus]|uniref:Uncharacterized protein (TIGR02118 family) n=1 Tax=Haloactinomyces albus TaxID=1352928 RepID=A0AAE4CNJ8_9ACTN|nr:EthD family reductase [Haloactinomyces albus]MDR7303969.1 uncharacterized protein (TIGR02118 family) [Haloactinomyces albus]
MYRLVASYHHPKDPEHFLDHYRNVHAKIASQMPNCRAFTWGVCETLDGSKPPHFLIATLEWDSKEDALAALSSPIGQEGAEDVANFADAGVEMNAFETNGEI